MWFSKKPERKALPIYMSYIGAGCLFTDGTRVLAGYQPSKRHKGISGLGGRSLDNEHWLRTAHRETIEELFATAIVPETLLNAMEELVPSTTLSHQEYVTVVYSFKDLERILSLAWWYGVSTYIYPSFPKTIAKLLLERQPSQVAEVQTLCLLPLTEFGDRIVASEFVEDIKQLCLNPGAMSTQNGN